MTFETRLREVMSKAPRNQEVVRRAGKLFDCPRVIKGCFNTYILSNMEYCAPVSKSSGESYLGLLDSIIRSAQRWCDGELCCLGHRRKV